MLGFGFAYRILALEPLLLFLPSKPSGCVCFLVVLPCLLVPVQFAHCLHGVVPCFPDPGESSLALEKKGLIPSREASGWRLKSEAEVPRPRDNEVVMLMSFYECGFGLPLHPFVRGAPPLLLAGGPEPATQCCPSDSVMHQAIEAFIEIDPHSKQWQYFFSVRVTPGVVVSCMLARPTFSSIMARRWSTSTSLFLPLCGIKGTGSLSRMWLEAPCGSLINN